MCSISTLFRDFWLKNVDFKELNEVAKVINKLESKEEASKEFQIMFEALEEGIVLIK